MESSNADISILAIGRPVASQLKEKLERSLLRPSTGQRYLPSAVLWGDDSALKLFEKYSALPEYYATRDEISLLQHWSTDIAGHVAPGSVLVDLGCGDVNKVKPFLDALEASHKPVKYYALDLSELALKRNLEKLQAACYKHVACNGLWGTFDDVRKWATDVSEPIWYMSLGSIFGNDEFDVAVRDLRTWSNAMRPQDYMLLGVDGCPDKERIWKSLNTPIPGMPNLVEHGLALSNTILGHTWYRPEEWEVFGVCEQLGPVCTHQWVIRALKDTACDALGFHASKGDEIYTVKWFRWGPDGMKKQFDHSDFEQVASWKSPTGPVYQYLVRPAKMAN